MSEQINNIIGIIVSIIGLLLCSAYLLIGLSSPLYRQYPQRILLLICIVLIAYNLIYLIVPQSHYNSLRDIWDMITIIFFGLNLYYMFSLKTIMKSPFDSKVMRYVYLTIVLFIESLLLFTQIVAILDHKENQKLVQEFFQRYIQVLIAFTSYILIDLRRTKVTQDKKIYKMKSVYLCQQMSWFYISLITQCVYALSENHITMILFLLQNIVFGICQLSERYPRVKLKRLFCLCSVEEQALITEIENGGTQSQLNIILLKNAQTVELVKSVLNSVCKAIFQSLKYDSSVYDKQRLYRFHFEFSEQGVDLESRTQQRNQQSRVELISYYPDHFRDLLRANQYDSYSQIILETLGIQYNQESYEKTRESMGKSGSFFFFSQNKRMILKTISNLELNGCFKNQRIEQYFEYLKENPQSKLAKIYGLFRISIIGMAPTQFILMENTLGQLNIERLYDLKGSTIGRNSVDSDSVYKDNYFLQSMDYPLRISEDSLEMKQQLIKDSAFLRRIRYMDYSLLLGITPIVKDNQQIQHRTMQVNNTNFAVLSIIDYLQEYDLNKKIEYHFKSIRAKDPNQLSCIEPEKYQKRFVNFLDQIIIE